MEILLKICITLFFLGPVIGIIGLLFCPILLYFASIALIAGLVGLLILAIIIVWIT